MVQVTEVLLVEEVMDGTCPAHKLAELDEMLEVLGGVAEEEEGGGAETGGGMTLILPLREGGIMAGVRSSGMSFLRTFSAMRYIASANCSAFSLPFFSMSHKFLHVHTHKHTHTHTHTVLFTHSMIFYKALYNSVITLLCVYTCFIQGLNSNFG